MNCAEVDGEVRVLRVTDDSPADVAGLEAGDRILRIDGTEVKSLAALWQALWAGGAPERAVQLLIERGDVQQPLTVHSVDRMKTLRRSQGNCASDQQAFGHVGIAQPQPQLLLQPPVVQPA